MKNGILVIALLLFTNNSMLTRSPRAVLVYRVAAPHHWQFRFDENPLFDHDALLRESDTTVALRLCSTKKLETILNGSRRPINDVTNFLKQAYDFPMDRFLVLRAAQCHFGKSTVSATEIWLISKGASPPPASETITGREALRLLQAHKNALSISR